MASITYEQNNITITWQSDSPVEVQFNYTILECAEEMNSNNSGHFTSEVTMISDGRFTTQAKKNTNYTFSLIAVNSENKKSIPTVVENTAQLAGMSLNRNPFDSNIKF